MMQRIDLRGGLPARAELLRLMPRAAGDVSHAVDAARELVDAVREHGATALREQAERFDGGAPEHVRVPAAEIAAAVAGLTPSSAPPSTRPSVASAPRVPRRCPQAR